MSSQIVLLHGGLWEDEVTAERFWGIPGVISALTDLGVATHAPDRPRRPLTWSSEVACLGQSLPQAPLVLVAGSNGCSPGVGLALAHPDRVRALILAWPATAHDHRVDASVRQRMWAAGATHIQIDGLLAGDTLRGFTDEALASLSIPVGVIPALPESPFHQQGTVESLLRVIPGAKEMNGYSEPFHWADKSLCGQFAHEIATFRESLA